MAATTLLLHHGSSSRAHQHPILLPPLLTNSSSSCCSSSSTFFSSSSSSLLSWRRSEYCSAALLRRRNSCFLRPFCSSSRRFETVSAWDYGEEDDDDDGAALLRSRSNPWKRAPNLAMEEEKKKKEEVGSDSIDSVVDNSPWKDRNSSGHSYGRFISDRSQNSATTRTMADSSSDGNKGREMVISEGEEKEEVGFESIANNLQWKDRNSSGHSHVRFISDRSQNSLTTRAMVDLPSNGNKGRDIVMPEGEEKKETGFVSISVDNSRRKGGNSSDHSYGRFISNRSQNSLGTRTMVESSTDTAEGRDMSMPMKNGLKLDERNSRIFTLSQTQPSRLQNKFSPFNKKQPFLRSTEVVDSQRATSYNKNFNERGSSQSLLPRDNQSGDSHYFNEEGFPEATDKDQNKQQFSRFSKGGPKRGPPSVPLSNFDLFSSPPGSDPKSSFIRDWISDKPISDISKGVARSSPRHLSRSFGTRSKSSRSSIPAKYSKYTRQTDIPAVNSSNSLGFTDVSQSRQVDSLLDSTVTSSLFHKGSLVFKEGGHDFSSVYAEEGEDVVNTTSISFPTHSFDSDSSEEGEEEGDSAEIENDYSMPRSFDSDSEEEGEEERDSAEIENDYSMPRQASERDPSTVSSDALISSQEVENGLESGWKSDHDMPSGGKAIKKPHPDWELPFEFQFSYSETPKVDPIGFREPQYSPFGPTTMPRPWTGRAPIKPSKKKLPVFDSFNPPPHGKKGVKYVQEPGPFPPGQIPREALSREDILGKPLTPVEIRDLVESYRKEKRQVNLGRDGLTHNMLDVIHKHWKRRRICKIKCKGVPTIDMDNVCFHIEEKTGGKIIFWSGGVVYLFRGRHYNYKNRPSIPLVLWKPKAPIYPKLIQKVPDGLTEAEASLLRKMGRKVKPICRLAKNGVYLNLVKDVREAFGVDELVRIDCRGLNPSDFKKIGAKLKDLVPCVLLSFEDEHVLMWRGKSSTSSLVLDESKSEESSMGCADVLEEEVGIKTCLDSTTSIPMEGPRVDGLEQIGIRMSLDSMSISVEGPREDGLEEMGKRTYLDSMSIPMESMAIPMESPRADGLEEEMGARINIDSMSTLLEGPSVVGLEEISPSTHVDSMSIRLEDSRVDEERKEEESGDAMANLTRSELPDPILFTSSSLSLRSVSVGQSPDGSNLANNNTILHSLGDIRLQKLGERVDYLWDQALESGMALPLEDLQLDADAILSKANELAQEAPPGPVYNAHLERKAPEPRNIKRKKVPSTDRVEHSKSERFYTEELELRRLAKLLEP